MNPYLKYALTVFAVLIALLIGLVLYIAAIFDPNAYKPQIIQLVNEKKQRELKLDGNIKLTFFPTLGANVENIALYAVNGFQLEGKGKVTGIDNLVINSKGDLFIKPAMHEFVASKLTLGITGLTGTNNLDIKFDAPRLGLAAGKVTSDTITLVAKMTNPESSTSGNLSLSDMEGTVSDFKSRALTVELELKKGNLAVKAIFASPLIGNLDTRQLSLPDLAAFIHVNSPGIPDNGINGKLLGNASVDGVSQNLQATVAGRFTDSNIKAKLAVTGFVQPVFNFDVDVDQLDLDRFLPQQQGKEKHTEKAKSAEGLEESLDLSVLKDLKAQGSIRIGLLKATNVKSSRVKLDINTL
jgi:AsmA protein